MSYFHKIWADDVLIILAWLMLCAAAVLYQIQSVNLCNQYPLITGRIPPTLVNMARERTLLSSLLAQYFLFYTALWTVKLSILLFFRRFFGERQPAPWLKAWWWFITTLTVCTWAVCLSTLPYHCSLKSLPWVLGNRKPRSPRALKRLLTAGSQLCATGPDQLHMDQLAIELCNRHRQRYYE